MKELGRCKFHIFFENIYIWAENFRMVNIKIDAETPVLLNQYNTIQYNTIQYNSIQYNTIQYNTIQYNTTYL